MQWSNRHVESRGRLPDYSVSGMAGSGAGSGADQERILSRAELEKLFGAAPHSLDRICKTYLRGRQLRYRPLTGRQRDALLLKIVQAVCSPGLEACGSHRRPQWEKGWQWNLERFIAGGCRLEALVPRYYKPVAPFRLNGQLYMATSRHLVRRVTEIFRTWIFERFFSQVQEIFEFGCGSGFHLARLAQLFPEKDIYGYDWTEASCRIIKLLRSKKGLRISGGHFDFYNPDSQLPVGSRSGVLTFGALEQVGRNFRPFLEFLLQKKPAVCVHVECIAEFYDSGKLLDYLALVYHRRRNYLEGFWSALKELETQGRLKIVASHHQRFGNIFNDSHSYVVWQPL